MCFADGIPECLAPPTFERLTTDDPLEVGVPEGKTERKTEEQPFMLTTTEIQGANPCADVPCWQAQQQQLWTPCMMAPMFVGIPMMIPTMMPVPMWEQTHPMEAMPVPMWEMPEHPMDQFPLKVHAQGSGRETQFAQLPREAYSIRNTFVEVEEVETAEARSPATRRSQSCPRSFTRTHHPNTTVCLRNLPNRTQPGRLEAHLEQIGFNDHQAMHMPLDRKTNVNKGYAFIKFMDEDTANDFIACVEGTQLAGSRSAKRLTASFAARQGPAFLLNLPAKGQSLMAFDLSAGR